MRNFFVNQADEKRSDLNEFSKISTYSSSRKGNLTICGGSVPGRLCALRRLQQMPERKYFWNSMWENK